MIDDRWLRRVVILGGGTAGWMTAAALSQVFAGALSITLVESDVIGIVGVGEATIPPIRAFHELIGADETDVVRSSGATFKLGIEFRGWSAPQATYFHPFGVFGTDKDLGYFLQYWLRLAEQGKVADFPAFSLCALAARRNAYAPPSDKPDSPFHHFHSAYHFDAARYARYLKTLSLGRGVRHKLGETVGVERDPANGFITRLVLKSGESVDGDLFIDCSGMRGALIGKEMDIAYEDWSHWLPMNRACAVPCERRGPLTPYTVSTAHAAGWQWRIPLQHRVGNGIVWSSDFTTEDEAIATLQAGLEGPALSEVNRLRFTTGRRRTPWSGNVVAIGLSSGFLEPLESTSIHLIQSSIQRLIKYFPDRHFAPVCATAFNREAAAEIENIRDFLILHYHATERDDSELWRHVRSMPIPDSLAHRIALFRERGQLAIAADDLFQATSWLAVLLGQGVRPRSYMPSMALQDDALLAGAYDRLGRHFQAIVERMPDHLDYLRTHNLMEAETLAPAV
jgi:tryptophan halogenase